MFEKILIASGDQPHSSATAQLNCVAAAGSQSDFAAEVANV